MRVWSPPPEISARISSNRLPHRRLGSRRFGMTCSWGTRSGETRSRTVRIFGLWPTWRRCPRRATGGPPERLPSEELRQPTARRSGRVEPSLLVLGHVRLEPLPVVRQPPRKEDLAGEQLVNGLRLRGLGVFELEALFRPEFARERLAEVRQQVGDDLLELSPIRV